MKMNRKDFLKTLGVTGAAFAVNGFDALDVFAQNAEKDWPVDLVAVMGGEPDVMFQKAIAELGGIGRFVKKGQKVVIKPNIGWDKKPEIAQTCDQMQNCYTNSGIEKAVIDAGGKMLPANDERYYRDAELPDGKKLKNAKFHHALLEQGGVLRK